MVKGVLKDKQIPGEIHPHFLRLILKQFCFHLWSKDQSPTSSSLQLKKNFLKDNIHSLIFEISSVTPEISVPNHISLFNRPSFMKFTKTRRKVDDDEDYGEEETESEESEEIQDGEQVFSKLKTIVWKGDGDKYLFPYEIPKDCKALFFSYHEGNQEFCSLKPTIYLQFFQVDCSEKNKKRFHDLQEKSSKESARKKKKKSSKKSSKKTSKSNGVSFSKK